MADQLRVEHTTEPTVWVPQEAPVAEVIPLDVERPSRSVDEIIPRFQTEVFRGRETAAFYVGILATPQEVVDSAAWQAARLLRGNVYIEEKKFLPETSRKEDGGEEDADDARSVQFGVYENQGVEGEARLIGTSRLIIKRDQKDNLPAETMYPDVFTATPAEVGSVETSRVIARHADKAVTRKGASLALIRAMAGWSITEGKEPVYAVIDASVRRMYDKMEFPYTLLSDLRYTEEYGSENWAVRIDPHAVINGVNPTGHSMGLAQAFFANVEQNQGLGYYDRTLTARLDDTETEVR